MQKDVKTKYFLTYFNKKNNLTKLMQGYKSILLINLILPQIIVLIKPFNQLV